VYEWIVAGTLVVTSLAAVAALFFTRQSIQATNSQLRISEQGQITDRYNAAITNLGSRSIEVRLGGIYALQRLMQDSPRDQPTVVAVLCAFVRDQSSPAVKPLKQSTPQPPTDIQAALTVVGTRNIANDGQTTVVDFDHAQLANAQLAFLRLSHANLAGAGLRHANLAAARLTGANLTGADLTDANLNSVHLAGADLNSVHLASANLVGADLTRANLIHADLTGAILVGADLTGAQLAYADLTGAYLTGTDLTRADLIYADLTGADLTGADLTGANFFRADLTGAKWPKAYQAPAGWVRDPTSGRLKRANAGA
jgi:uncharacterized protein YjbI with pentapeptide repeats